MASSLPKAEVRQDMYRQIPILTQSIMTNSYMQKINRPGAIYRWPREWCKMFDDIAGCQLLVQLNCCIVLAQLRCCYLDNVGRRHLHMKYVIHPQRNQMLLTVSSCTCCVSNQLISISIAHAQRGWTGSHLRRNTTQLLKLNFHKLSQASLSCNLYLGHN